ncbi:MAG: Holliday junction branch migration protein RuvA [Chloroflexi bacterium]|nr:Holliday junction branch migration protein RuvA [Chloroflexota bacterium]
MIANLSGRIVDLPPDSVIVEVGGIGLQVFVPAPFRDELRVGEKVFLHTYLAVREDSLTLYGFATAEEREYFTLLLGVNGVGPRLALAGLSTLTPDAIRRAVFTEQADVFSRIPGVGRKTSQKMLLHLQDRVKAIDGFEPVAAMDDTDTQVLEALVTLGYSVVEAQAALQAIPRDTAADVEIRIRLALQYFSV